MQLLLKIQVFPKNLGIALDKKQKLCKDFLLCFSILVKEVLLKPSAKVENFNNFEIMLLRKCLLLLL